MAIIKFRDLFNLPGKQIICLFIIFVCFTNIASSQGRKGNYNYLDFQKKPYYFGISLGINNSNFQLNYSRDFIGNDSIRVAEAIKGPGFNLHLVGNLKIGEYFDFRFSPGFSFAERKIGYQGTTEDIGQSTEKIESIFVEIPFHVRYKSVPFKDKRVFVTGGVKYSFDVANNSTARQAKTLIKIAPHDFQVEIGAGIQFFFPYFIFAPEIKFSQGLGNTLIYNNDLNESRVLEKILSRAFTSSFIY
jgi:hypothetical protein